MDVFPPAEEIVLAYHERTKHRYERFAASLGYMDWSTQPNPFRRYEGAPLVRLPLVDSEGQQAESIPFWKLYVPGEMAPQPLSVDSLGLFFRYALSLTAWKQVRDTRWSLRANPSSGNLHPTEGYALLPPVDGIGDRAGLYHYAPKEHGLETRTTFDATVWAALIQDAADGSFLIGLSSIFWREAWKYGERAYRYCQHDVGHALGTLRFAAAALGWKLRLIDGISDDKVGQLLGLDRAADFAHAEKEHPELLAIVFPSTQAEAPKVILSDEVVDEVRQSPSKGVANALSLSHVPWPIIDEVAGAIRGASGRGLGNHSFLNLPAEEVLFETPVRTGTFFADKVILGRRSAVSMDGVTSISRATFFRMLARLMPTNGNRAMPWDAISWRPRIHLGLFVHRVDGLSPGLYALVRDPDKVDAFRNALHRAFLWQRPAECPSALPLYLLKEGDHRSLAATVSCGQAIAGDGAFSLGMIAEYMDTLVEAGACAYRNLFWEAGLIGQVLYLEAEAAGIRSTGIGCYFDDAVHEVFGLEGFDWQSLYHFTVGGAVEDSRLTTLPAY